MLIAERRLDRAELTRGVDKDFHAVGAGLSGDPSDIRRSDGSDVADADGIRLASYAAVADVDIIAFGRLEITPSPGADGNISTPACKARERGGSKGDVIGADRVGREGTKAKGGVATGCGVSQEGEVAKGGVAAGRG